MNSYVVYVQDLAGLVALQHHQQLRVLVPLEQLGLALVVDLEEY